MSRWKVESVDYATARLWFVFEMKPWGWAQRGEFESFKKAIAEVDRMARTIEVTLPRVSGHTRLTAHNGEPGGHPTGYIIIPKEQGRYSALTVFGPWGEAGIYDRQDIEPLALALLAHARKHPDREQP